jgi:hypothetical protein
MQIQRAGSALNWTNFVTGLYLVVQKDVEEETKPANQFKYEIRHITHQACGFWTADFTGKTYTSTERALKAKLQINFQLTQLNFEFS